MSEILRTILSSLGAFFGSRKIRRLLYLLVVCAVAFYDFMNLGLARRTFVFYSSMEGNPVVEDRTLHRSLDRETDIQRYVDEVLLGPVSPGLEPLFPRETRLNSFMFRDGVVYADLSEPAVLPIPEGGDVFLSFLTLNEGLRRNFSHVKDVKLFIGGTEAFLEEFRGILSNSADNGKTAP
jgi:hypothetical protein